MLHGLRRGSPPIHAGLACRSPSNAIPRKTTPHLVSGAPILAGMSPLSNRTVATIGSGVMAESIIAGLLRGHLVEPRHIVGSEPRAERRDELTAQYGVRMVASNVEAAGEADVILLSVKPQTLTKVGHELGGQLRPEQLVVSIVAGATCRVLTGLLDHREVVRSMPNTPAQIGRGITVWYATPEVTAEQTDQARVLLGALGADLQVDDERFVEMATAVSGTGPAYVFLVMEALIDAAVHLGFPRHIAHDLVIETLEGSTAFAKATAQHPAVLRNMVTSPGGTSAAAIHELESGRLRTVLSEAVWASYRRTLELGADLEKGLGLDEGSVEAAARSAGGKSAGGTGPGAAATRRASR
jgi:pyrroline-5-carboxylate reductase